MAELEAAGADTRQLWDMGVGMPEVPGAPGYPAVLPLLPLDIPVPTASLVSMAPIPQQARMCQPHRHPALASPL